METVQSLRPLAPASLPTFIPWAGMSRCLVPIPMSSIQTAGTASDLRRGRTWRLAEDHAHV